MSKTTAFFLVLLTAFAFTAFAQENPEETEPAAATTTAETEKAPEWAPFFGVSVENDVFGPVNASGDIEPGYNNAQMVYTTIFSWIGAGAQLTDELYFYVQLSDFPIFKMESTDDTFKFSTNETYLGAGFTYTPNEYFSWTFGLEAALALDIGDIYAGFDAYTSFDITVPEGYFNLNLYYWGQPMWQQGSTTTNAWLFNQVLYTFDFMFGQFIKEDPLANIGLYLDGEMKTWAMFGDTHYLNNWTYTGLKYAPLDFMSADFGYALVYGQEANSIQNGLAMGVAFTADWLTLKFHYYPLWTKGDTNNGLLADSHDFEIRLGLSF